MVPILIDYRYPRCGAEDPGSSLLTLPLGESTFFEHLASRLTDDEHQQLLVMPAFEFSRPYVRALNATANGRARAVWWSDLVESLREMEPSDRVVVVDTRRWPLMGVNFRDIAQTCSDYGGFNHAIAVGVDADGVSECVERDTDGLVRCVQRLYDRMNWPEVAATAHVLSIGPVRSLRGIRFRSLSELRAGLSVSGVLSRDLPIAAAPVDLLRPGSYLALNESVMGGNGRRTLSQRRDARPHEAVVGPGCQIEPSAKLIGPVVLQSRVHVGPQATVVGPAVIGSDSRLERGAIVAQSILASGSTVRGGVTVRHQLVLAGSSVDDGSAPFDSPAAVDRSEPIIIPMPAWQRGPERRAGVSRRVQLAIKRLVDVVVSAAGLVLLSPVFLLIAAIIKWDSPGPVFFIHRREHKGGKNFPCLKFRTMVADAHSQQRALYRKNEVDGPQFLLCDDPRVTRVGNWIRATNIDELPQLINVFLGHMSLVGPRPSPFRENQVCVPWRRARLSVRPGITGLWQVCREHRRGGDFHQWIYYDMLYVRRFSILLDLRILAATVVSLAGRRSVPLKWMLPSEADWTTTGESYSAS